jgi:hypothetical protein
MAQRQALNADGSPNKALNVYRQKQINARKDKGQITKNFNLKEFACHDGSPVPAKAHGAIRRLCLAYLEPMRAKFGSCTVLSGYRHKAYNRRIGGASQSHIYDLDPSPNAGQSYVRGNPVIVNAVGPETGYGKGGGFGRYDRSGFVHCDNRRYNSNWSG